MAINRKCDCCPWGHDFNIVVPFENRPKHIDLKLVVGLPVTNYRCGYMAFGMTVIMVDEYKSGKRKGQVKNIVCAHADPVQGDWVTSTDPAHWEYYRVVELTECTGRDCDKYRDKCPYCSGTRFYFYEMDSENKRVISSYGHSRSAYLGLGYREDYCDYQSEIYRSS